MKIESLLFHTNVVVKREKKDLCSISYTMHTTTLNIKILINDHFHGLLKKKNALQFSVVFCVCVCVRFRSKLGYVYIYGI